jgi:hypothetical protein
MKELAAKEALQQAKYLISFFHSQFSVRFGCRQSTHARQHTE